MSPSPTLESLSQAIVLASLGCGVIVAVDIARRPQPMAVMNPVWVLTALYAGPLGLAAYWALGRGPGQGKPPLWRAALVGSTHCGAGCALGDAVGELAVFAAGARLFGQPFLAKAAAGFVLAYLFGIAFQYFAIAPMQRLGPGETLKRAVKADTLSLLAYEVGMFAAMFALDRLWPGLGPARWSWWASMQLAMLVGFITTYPANWLLIRTGVKSAM